MHYRALNQAITLYRGETLSLKQASRHAGVSSGRMEAALRSRNVPLRRNDPAGADDAIEPDLVENQSAGAD